MLIYILENDEKPNLLIGLWSILFQRCTLHNSFLKMHCGAEKND